MGLPFEPVASCSLFHLSMKAAFLVAITSAQRVGNIQALIAGPAYTLQCSIKTKWPLGFNLSFFQSCFKSSSESDDFTCQFSFSRLIPSSRKPNCTLFYLLWLIHIPLTKQDPSEAPPGCFIAYAVWVTCQAISTQRLLIWVSNCIRSCDELARLDPPV